MASWVACVGATLLAPSGPQGQHLFVVLNDPREFSGYGNAVCIVMVPLDSIKAGILHDATCELDSGAHTFLTRPSFVNYRYTRIEQVRHLEGLVANGIFRPREPIDPHILRRLLNGLLTSPFTKREFKRLME